MAFLRTRRWHQRVREIEGFGVIAQQQDAQRVADTRRKVTTLMGNVCRQRTQTDLSKIETLGQVQIALVLLPGKQTRSPGCRLY